MALMMLNQLEASLGKEFDERKKMLSAIGKAIGTVAKGLANVAQQSISSSLFNLPVSEDNAPLDGATYNAPQKIFANEPNSEVAAVLRIQWIVSVDPAKVMGLPGGIFGGPAVKAMVPGGFIYLLRQDSAGFIVQVPIVPKIEVGAGLEILKAEIKAETEYETTFFWLQNPIMGGYRFLSAIVNLFNQAMSALPGPSSAVTLGLQSCERNGPIVDPSLAGQPRSNKVQVAPKGNPAVA